MAEEIDASPADGGDDDALQALASAVRERPQPAGQPALPLPPRARLGIGWRVILLLMNVWAALLLGVGLLCCIFAMASWGEGDPLLDYRRDATGFSAEGWGLAALAAACCFLLSKLQSVIARRLRRKRTMNVAVPGARVS